MQAAHGACQGGARLFVGVRTMRRVGESASRDFVNELISCVPLAIKGCDIPAKYLSVEFSSGFAMLVSGGSGV